ncbi:polyprenyl synthetase family protein [Aurantimonas endophytica]|uniref:Probable farnesyl diphosphate synthase n=1 Tax=Aurantimonas endophytica TaxID=1522175 RepID=A0A7W6HDK5_9HYPH|nr:farnesyl diphosphate synthase [Aurantimonas endophytica]MBB4003269.1 farnesyl diphosphate synthase [Aurantimonas endophytica]MCO6404130.1 polyprenyl synthetase family protein [Aurantimonas endophytica]
MDGDGFEALLASTAARVEARLAAILDGEGPLAGAPERVRAAMAHGALGGGKRLRPFLVIEAAALFGATADDSLDAAVALECVHCYSLVHDDLPAMDDDAMRRGKPTVHKAFDEATAILAGDALLTLAFGLIAGAERLSLAARSALVLMLARDAGAGGMVGGQALDLAAEIRDLTEDEIATMQAMKTGALIAFACEAGPVVADAAPADRQRLRRFGELVGLAFQLADDLLDETADAATLGKAAGKDRERGKKTLPALNGHEWTRRRLDDLVAEAEAELSPYGERGRTLLAAARFVAHRQH